MVQTYPVREGLIAYVRQARRQAEDVWQFELQRFAVLAPHMKKGSNQKPKKPAILSLVELKE